MYACLSEKLAGLPTIRALRASRRFMAENKEKLNINQRANFGSNSDQVTAYSVSELFSVCCIVRWSLLTPISTTFCIMHVFVYIHIGILFAMQVMYAVA